MEPFPAFANDFQMLGSVDVLGSFVSFSHVLSCGAQVLMLTLEDMFILDGIWGVCVTNLLRDSVLCYLLVNLLWLLHHA
jgi:hypothetical protein